LGVVTSFYTKFLGGLIEKRPHVPKMLWMKNRLQKNKSSGSPGML